MARRPLFLLALVAFFCLAVLPPSPPAALRVGSPPAAWAAPGIGTAPRPDAAALRLMPPPAPVEAASHPIRRLFRFLAGGLLAGCLWSLLFGYPASPHWLSEPVPLGLLDLAAAATLGYLGFLAVGRRLATKQTAAWPRPCFARGEHRAVPLAVEEAARPGMADIAARDPTFSLEALGDQIRALLYDLHEGWNQQDLGQVRSRVAENLLGFLEMGLKILALKNEISRLEDLCLHRLAVVQAEVEEHREWLTVQVEGEVMDYVLERPSLKLLAGSLAYPTELKECWLFERAGPGQEWLLCDIRDY